MHNAAGILIHVIGGVGVAVEGDYVLPEEALGIPARPNEPPEILLRLVAGRARGPLCPPGEPTVEQDSWLAFLHGDTVSIVLKDANRTPLEQMRLDLSRDTLEGRYTYDHDWPYLFQYPVDQLLMVHILGIAGGALMHAAAIAGRDGALLVAGPSGAGKTTMSRSTSALGAHVLSDERTIVRPAAGGGWLLGGTPWPGEGGFSENRSVPLRGLILLEQSDRDELVPLSPARALAMLYGCHFVPVWDPRARERTLGNLERVVRELPAFLYRNRKTPEAAQSLLERVGGVA